MNTLRVHFGGGDGVAVCAGKITSNNKKNTVVCKIPAISLMKIICRNILTHKKQYINHKLHNFKRNQL